MPEESFFGLVTHVASSGPFLQIWASRSPEIPLVVEESLQHLAIAFSRGVGIANPANLQIKQLICARCKDGFWYRARILDVKNVLLDGTVKLHFIDCGITDDVKINDIRTLDTVKNNPIVDYPPLATEYLVAGVVSPTQTWSPDVISSITNALAYKEVKFELQFRAAGKDFMNIKLGGQQFPLTLVKFDQGVGISVGDQHRTAMSYYQCKGEKESAKDAATVIDSPPSVLSAASTPQERQRSKANMMSTLQIGSKHSVYVASVDDGPNSFYIHLQSVEPILTNMANEINSTRRERLKEALQPGTQCIASFTMPQGPTMCRATIISVDENAKCKVLLIDYGSTGIVASNSVFKSDPIFENCKPMALKFKLGGMDKLSITSEISNWFSDFVCGKLLEMLVTEPEGSPDVIQYCHLYFNGQSLLKIMKEKFFSIPKALPVPTAKYSDIQLPERSETRVVVSYVDTSGSLPWTFYVQLEMNLPKLEVMMVEVGKYCRSKRAPEVIETPEGDAIFAQFSGDSQWYRAKMVKNNGNTALVTYIDYGNDEEVLASSTRRVTNDIITKLPAQAILCRLQTADTLEHGAEQFTKIAAMKGFNLAVIKQLITGEHLVRMIDTTRFPFKDVGYELIIGSRVMPIFHPQVNPYQYLKPPHQQVPLGQPFPLNNDWMLAAQQSRSNSLSSTLGVAQLGLEPSPRVSNQEFTSGMKKPPVKPESRDSSPMKFRQLDCSVEQWEDYDDQKEGSSKPGGSKDARSQSQREEKVNDHVLDQGRNFANQRDGKSNVEKRQKENPPRDKRFGDRQHQGRNFANQRDSKLEGQHEQNVNRQHPRENRFGDQGRNFANQRDSKLEGQHEQNINHQHPRENRFGDRQHQGRNFANQRDSKLEGQHEQNINHQHPRENRFGDQGRNFANQRDSKLEGQNEQKDNHQHPRENRFGDQGRNFANQRDSKLEGQHEQNINHQHPRENRFGNQGRNFANQRDSKLEGQNQRQDQFRGNKFGNKQQGTNFNNQSRFQRDGQLDKDADSKFAQRESGDNVVPRSHDNSQGREGRFGRREPHRDFPWNSGGAVIGTPWNARSGDMGPRHGAHGEVNIRRGSGDLSGLNKSSRLTQGGFENKPTPPLPSTPQREESWEDDPVVPSKPKFRFTPLQILPGVTLAGFAVFTKDPWEFYVQPESTVQMLETLMEDVDKACKPGGSALDVKPAELSPLDACLAKYPLDEVWYRAQIICVKEGKAKVKFVDFGNEDEVDVITAVKAVTAELLALPVQAISCRLRGARPAPGEEQWSSADVERLIAVLENKPLQVELVAVEGLRLLQFSVVLRVEGACVNQQFGASPSSLLPRNLLPEEPLGCGQHQASISWFLTPASFHLVLSNRKKELAILQEELKHVECPPLQGVEQGVLVLAPLPAPQDKTFFRASVLATKDSKVRVIDLDSGKTQITLTTKLRAMPESLKETPAFSLPCQLHGVTALPGPDWPLGNKTIDEVFQAHPTFSFSVVSRGENDKLAVNLTSPDGNTSVSDQLIKKGVATSSDLANTSKGVTCPPVVATSRVQLVTDKLGHISDKLNHIADKMVEFGKTRSPVVIQSPNGVASHTDLLEQKEEKLEEDVGLEPGQSYEVFVSYSEGLLFSVVRSACNDALVGMQEDLQAAMASGEGPAETRPDVIAVAKSPEDDIWYRAMALRPATEAGTLVRFVDYGNEEVITSGLKTLPEEFSKLPPFSTACRLPMKPSSGDSFSQETIEKFESLVFDDKLESITAQVFAKSEGIFIVELYINYIGVSEILISEKLAIPLLTEAYISNVESPLLFYIQMKEIVSKLHELEIRLGSEEFESLDQPEVGSLCLAKFTDDKLWYRARVTSVSDKETQVLFVDFGNSALATEFRKLPEDLESIPAMALQCMLRTQPSSIEEAIKFLDFAMDCSIIHQVLMPDNEESPLKVILLRNGKDIMGDSNSASSKQQNPPVEPTSETSHSEEPTDAKMKETFVKPTIEKIETPEIKKSSLEEIPMSEDLIELDVKPTIEKIETPEIKKSPLAEIPKSEDLIELDVKPDPKKHELPDIQQSVLDDEISNKKLIDINITSYISPSNFCYQKVEDEDSLIEMQNHLSQLAPELVYQTKANTLYAAKLEGGGDACTWYRVCVLADNDPMVYMIDYGRTEKASAFKILPDNLKNVKHFAKLSSLNNAPNDKESCEKLKRMLIGCQGLQAGCSLDEKNIDFIFKDGENVLKFLKHTPQPALTDVIVSYFKSFNEFFVNPWSKISKLQDLQHRLETESFETLHHVEVGMKCLAKFSDDNKFYRAVVTSVTQSCTKVFFIDFGNTTEATEFKKLTNEINTIPPMAILCNLARIPTFESTCSILSALLQDTDFVIFQIDLSKYKEGQSLSVTLMQDGEDVIDTIEEMGDVTKCSNIEESSDDQTDRKSESENVFKEYESQEGTELEIENETTDFLIDFQEELEPKLEIQLNTQDNQSELEAAVEARCKVFADSTIERDKLFSSRSEIKETKAPPPTPEEGVVTEKVELKGVEVINQLEEESSPETSRGSESLNVTDMSSGEEEHVLIVNQDCGESAEEQLEAVEEDEMDMCEPNSPKILVNNPQTGQQYSEVITHLDEKGEAELFTDPSQKQKVIHIETNKKEIDAGVETESDVTNLCIELNLQKTNVISEPLEIKNLKVEIVGKVETQPNAETPKVEPGTSEDSCDQEEKVMLQVAAHFCDLPDILETASAITNVGEPEEVIEAEHDPCLIPLPASDDSEDDLEYLDMMNRGFEFDSLTLMSDEEEDNQDSWSFNVSKEETSVQYDELQSEIPSKINYPEPDMLEQAHLNILQKDASSELDYSSDFYETARESISPSPKMTLSTPRFTSSPHKDVNKTLTEEEILADLSDEGTSANMLSGGGDEPLAQDLACGGAKSLEDSTESVGQISADVLPHEETGDTNL